jgi:alpha-1,2-mannosyltransferase
VDLRLQIPAASADLEPRARLWAIALALIGLAPIGGAIANAFHDWPAFAAAGATAGTADLVDPGRHVAWQLAHGLPGAVFPYPPGTAWLFAPVAALPLGLGWLVNGIVMLACAVGAGFVLAPVFGLTNRAAALATLAFAPVTASVVLGQNGPLGLLAAAVAISALTRDQDVLAGIATGLLLYKPTYGVPLVGLLVIRGRWRGVAAAGAVAVVWYLAGVAAAGGDWAWPASWLDGLRGYLADDFAGNADKAVSLPGLLGRLPIPGWIPLLAAGALVLAALPRLARAPIAEAAAGACLVGVAVSPHAWGYDAVMAVPALLWLLGGGGPWTSTTRRSFLVVAYALGPLWLVSKQTLISAIAIVVLGGVGLWLVRPAARDRVAAR